MKNFTCIYLKKLNDGIILKKQDEIGIDYKTEKYIQSLVVKNTLKSTYFDMMMMIIMKLKYLCLNLQKYNRIKFC